MSEQLPEDAATDEEIAYVPTTTLGCKAVELRLISRINFERSKKECEGQRADTATEGLNIRDRLVSEHCSHICRIEEENAALKIWKLDAEAYIRITFEHLPPEVQEQVKNTKLGVRDRCPF